MCIPSLIAFTIAIFALYMSLNITDEIVQLAMALPALFCLVLSIAFAPMAVQLLIAIAILFSNKYTQVLHQCNLLRSPKGTCHACVLVDHSDDRNDCFLRYK